MDVVAGECRVQRLALPGGERTWTVLGVDQRVVAPAEEYLEYLRVQGVSPNTVKSYARALALVVAVPDGLRVGLGRGASAGGRRVPGVAAHGGRAGGDLDRGARRRGSASRRSRCGWGR